MKLETEFSFDAAHRLVGYDGKCSNLHGHQWIVNIGIEGEILNEQGILWDFTETKMLEALYDHKTLLKNCPENYKLLETLVKTCGIQSVYPMDCNPTAENLAYDILYKIERPDLNFKVRVYESPKSYAEVESES